MHSTPLLFKFYFLWYAHVFGFTPYQYQTQPQDLKQYFCSPLHTPISIVGGFGEIRKNHFHSGLDIKTKGQEGLAVYAVADGYVSRIKISATGYGNALYITHPNGLVSVYGHLQKFYGDMQKTITERQYQKQSFDIDCFFKPEELKVKKNEQVAVSGNTGGSTGPHLHFEIRDAYTEEVLNPQLFGFPVDDELPPVVKKIGVYSWSNFYSEKKFHAIDLKKISGKLISLDTIIVNEKNIGFTVQAFDISDRSGSTQGIYEANVKDRGKEIFATEMKKFAFDETRYCNAYADYEKNCTQSNWMRLYVLPGNNFSGYRKSKTGIIQLTENKTSIIEMVLNDEHGNSQAMEVFVKFISSRSKENKLPKNLFHFEKENHFRNDSIEINFKSSTFYADINFDFEKSISAKNNYSSTYKIHAVTEPIHFNYELKIKPNFISEKSKAKAVLVLESKTNGKSVYPVKWLQQWAVAQPREFGNAFVTLDSIAPKIVSTKNKFAFHLTDNLSGIKNYRVTIDGKWELATYDLKSNLITITPNHSFQKKQHTIIIKAEDEVGNNSIQTFKTNF